MRTLLVCILLIISIEAMDEAIITITDAYQQVKKDGHKTQLKERYQLFKSAESHLERGLLALGATWLWTSIMCCSPGPHPTQADAYILGCTCTVCCAYCGAACADCCKASMLPKGD